MFLSGVARLLRSLPPGAVAQLRAFTHGGGQWWQVQPKANTARQGGPSVWHTQLADLRPTLLLRLQEPSKNRRYVRVPVRTANGRFRKNAQFRDKNNIGRSRGTGIPIYAGPYDYRKTGAEYPTVPHY